MGSILDLSLTAKFQQYMYGGRPLGTLMRSMRFFVLIKTIDVRFNDRWHTFSPEAAKGGQVASMATDVA
jgi:hypothetical protein